MIGLSCNDFERLYKNVKHNLSSTSVETLEKKKVNHGKPRLLSERDQLLLYLFWIQQYVVLNILVWFIRLSLSTIQKYNKATLQVLFNYFDPKIHIPEFDLRKENGAFLRGALITFVIDGTEQGVNKPRHKATEQSLFSGINL